MKTPKSMILLSLLLIQLTLCAQVQWYQNQDANNPPPYGTVATMVQPFTSGSFIACYLWSTSGEQNTWKISKSSTNGNELQTFFITNVSATAEFKVGRNNTVYVFERSFTANYTPQYIVYKLDANLQLKAQRSIEYPNNFFIYTINAFELDDDGNVYVAGDGQYNGATGGSSPASFVLKTNKNLQTLWSRMDSSETSYARLHIDRWGRVLVIEDHYRFFPQVRIKRFAANGQALPAFTVTTEASRYSLNSLLDEDDNLLLFGGKTAGGSSQAIYLKKISRFTGNSVYSKTYFTAPSVQINDLKTDRYGNLFTLVTQFINPDNPTTRISRINLFNGHIAWTYTSNFSADSCNLSQIVLNDNERFYVVGEKKCHHYFSKGFALRLKKNGQPDGNFPAPDSVAFQRSHWLSGGFIDNSNRLIAIGNTTDLDTLTYSNSYFRSFAIRFGAGNSCNSGRGVAEPEEEDTIPEMLTAPAPVEVTTHLVIYPNPVQNLLSIANIDPEEYNRAGVYNMQGALVQQKNIDITTVQMDISNLADGVYLLVLRSTITFKEKSIKFVVRK